MIAGAVIVAGLCVWIIWRNRHTKSLRQEERELKAYFRRVDAEERNKRG